MMIVQSSLNLVFIPIGFVLYLILSVHCQDDLYEHLENRNLTLEQLYKITLEYKKREEVQQQETDAEYLKLADEQGQEVVLQDTTTFTCAADWKQYSKNKCCYALTAVQGPWYTGQERCKATHPLANFLSLQDKDESTWLAKQFGGLSAIHAWTGQSQTEIDGKWTNVDGSPIFQWLMATPSNPLPKEESCVEIIDGALALLFNLFYKQGQTNVYKCTEELPAACKYCPGDTTPTTTTTTVATTPTVPTTTTTKPPTTTVKVTVPTIPTVPTVVTVPTSPTVPTTKQQTTTIKVTLPTVPTTLSTLLTVPTVPTVPTVLPTTTIFTTIPTTTKPFICVNPSPCQPGWVYFDQSCYAKIQSSSGIPANRDQASLGCTTSNPKASLAVITSEDQNLYLTKVFSGNGIGNDVSWIGNSVNDSGYSNWVGGKPAMSNGSGKDYCAAIRLSTTQSDVTTNTRGEWEDQLCTEKLTSALCQVKVE